MTTFDDRIAEAEKALIEARAEANAALVKQVAAETTLDEARAAKAEVLQDIREDGARLQAAYEEEPARDLATDVLAKIDQLFNESRVWENDNPGQFYPAELSLKALFKFIRQHPEGKKSEYVSRPAVPLRPAVVAEDGPSLPEELRPILNHIHIPGVGSKEPLRIDGTPIKVMANGVEIRNLGNPNALTTVMLEVMPHKITVDGDAR